MIPLPPRHPRRPARCGGGRRARETITSFTSTSTFTFTFTSTFTFTFVSGDDLSRPPARTSSPFVGYLSFSFSSSASISISLLRFRVVHISPFPHRGVGQEDQDAEQRRRNQSVGASPIEEYADRQRGEQGRYGEKNDGVVDEG